MSLTEGHHLGGRFGYFLFVLIGGREGAVRGARKGGGRFSLKIPGGGVGSPRRGGGGEGSGGCLRGISGGGLNIFFSGPKCPPSHDLDLKNNRNEIDLRGWATRACC